MTTGLKSRAGVAFFVALALAGLLAVMAFSAAPPIAADGPDSELDSLMLKNGNTPVPLDPPVFLKDRLSYSARVANTVTEITVTAEPDDSDAIVTVDSTRTDEDHEVDVDLAPGDNTIVVAVQGTATSRAYVVTVHRDKMDDNNLKSLKITSGSGDTLTTVMLSPEFAADELAYEAEVSNSVETVNVTAMPADESGTATTDPGATVTVALGDATPASLDASNSFSSDVEDLTVTEGITLPNVINVVVTPQSGITANAKTYKVHLTRRPQSPNADLASLTIVHGDDNEEVDLTPSFMGSRTVYTADVAYSVTAATVTAVAADAGATVAILVDTPGSVADGTDSDDTTSRAVHVIGNTDATGSDVLAEGQNVIEITVTPEVGGTPKEYAVHLTRGAASTNADLASLAIMAGEEEIDLSPDFRAGRITYTAEVGNSVEEVTVAAVAADSNLEDSAIEIMVDPPSDAANVDESPYALEVGVNAVTIAVTPEAGADPSSNIKTYTVYLTRMEPGTDADLDSLTVMAGDKAIELTPAFDADKNYYVGQVDYAVMAIEVMAVPSDSNAKVVVTGPDAALVAGTTNNVIVTVTAEDDTTKKVYVFAINRLPASDDADLDSLTIMAGDKAIVLTPAFMADQTVYTSEVRYSAGDLTVVATPSNEKATTEVKFTLPSGITGTVESDPPVVMPGPGLNVLTVTVTSEDGMMTQPYTVVVNKPSEASDDAYLSSLSLSDGTLMPAFAMDTMAYTASVDNTVTSITVTAMAQDVDEATVAVTGADSLELGENTITVTVTAEDDDTTMDYTITVTKGSTNAYLSALSLSDGMLMPEFAGGTTAYTASVANSVESVSVTYMAEDSNAMVTVTGADADADSLEVGENTITVMVTSESTTATMEYTITVTREASTNAYLSALSLSDGTLSPEFAGGTTVYTASVANSVESVTVEAMAADSNAMVDVSGGDSLEVGDNTITVMVTAQDGTTTKEYTITVTREAPADRILAEYDTNDNDIIDRDEAIAAIRSYQVGDISRDEAILVIQRYQTDNK